MMERVLMRQFRDAAGVEWRVFQAERNADADQRRDHLLPVEFREGWLVFENASEKRRLAPVPARWNELSNEALSVLCTSAAVRTARARTGDVSAHLEAVEERLSETLNEVCDAPAVQKLDTGELIRVEETLAIAAKAAREAISLRRKRRRAASDREQAGHEPHDG